jgi:hypothetical protein
MKKLCRNITLTPDARQVMFNWEEFESIAEATKVLGETKTLEYINWRHMFILQTEFRGRQYAEGMLE